jgi:hypothetical protein
VRRRRILAMLCMRPAGRRRMRVWVLEWMERRRKLGTSRT